MLQPIRLYQPSVDKLVIPAEVKQKKMVSMLSPNPQASSSPSFKLSTGSLSTRSVKLTSLSWSSSFPIIPISSVSLANPRKSTQNKGTLTIVNAAWTRRSRSETINRPSRKSWKQKTDMYMRPFLLNVFFSNKFVHAKVMHRGTSKVIAVATTNSRDLRTTLPSLTDINACRTIGKLIAERSMEADVFAMSYEARKDERIEGKLGIVIDTIKEHGIIFVP